MATKNFPTDVTLKSNPVDADLLIIADSADGNEMKKITIGSITADIGDGLIVDASASTTTTYSSDKINTLNAAQDSTISSNYTTLNTNKLNAASQLRTGNWAWKVTYNNGSGNETEVALGTAWQSLTSNGATSAPTFQTLTADVNWQTEDTVWDMDADFVLAYDVSATANRKQKMNVYRASLAETVARTSTTKFVPPAYLPKYNGWVFTKDLTDANGATTVIAHGLPAAPLKVYLTARIGSSSFTTATSDGSWDSSGQRCVFTGANNAADRSATSSTKAIYIVGTNATLVSQVGTVTVDATNITITWAKTNAPTGSAYCTWDANT